MSHAFEADQSGRTAFRIGGACGVVGGGLFLVHQLTPTHPRDQVDLPPFLEEVSRSTLWEYQHYVGVLAFLIVLVHLAILREALRSTGARHLAGAALAMSIVGISVNTLAAAIDGYSVPAAAEYFVKAGADPAGTEFGAANSVRLIDSAGFFALILSLFGAAPLVWGITSRLSGLHHRAWGYLLILAGIAGIVSGSAQLTTGLNNTFVLVFVLASLVLAAWIVYSGVVMWRRADAFAVSADRAG